MQSLKCSFQSSTGSGVRLRDVPRPEVAAAVPLDQHAVHHHRRSDRRRPHLPLPPDVAGLALDRQHPARRGREDRRGRRTAPASTSCLRRPRSRSLGRRSTTRADRSDATGRASSAGRPRGSGRRNAGTRWPRRGRRHRRSRSSRRCRPPSRTGTRARGPSRRPARPRRPIPARGRRSWRSTGSRRGTRLSSRSRPLRRRGPAAARRRTRERSRRSRARP